MSAPFSPFSPHAAEPGSAAGASQARHEAESRAESWPTPCRVVSPGPGVNGAPVVFASPHSGQHYPLSLRASLAAPLIALRQTEDAFVDELFASAPRHGAHLISAVFARGFVDLNREASEIDTAMFTGVPAGLRSCSGERVRAGLGCLPRLAAGGRPIYATPLPWAEAERRLAHVHAGYHTALRWLVRQARSSEAGPAVLIDCHSMPSASRSGRKLPDIVLGDRYGAACSHRLVAEVERTFRALGYTVTRNSPYAGGYTTRAYGRPGEGVHALQIEINRALYMDEASVKRAPGFARLRADIESVVETVCDPGLIARL